MGQFPQSRRGRHRGFSRGDPKTLQRNREQEEGESDQRGPEQHPAERRVRGKPADDPACHAQFYRLPSFLQTSLCSWLSVPWREELVA
jgi:hypothetical protein